MSAVVACPECYGAGWVLDCKVNRSPTTLELIPCIYPECDCSGREVTILCLEWLKFSLVARHPKSGIVMSVFV